MTLGQNPVQALKVNRLWINECLRQHLPNVVVSEQTILPVMLIVEQWQVNKEIRHMGIGPIFILFQIGESVPIGIF